MDYIIHIRKGMIVIRLWAEQLISKLPRQQLLGQWRECIALLGNGWGKKHNTVDYVFKYPVEYLCAFSCLVADEMESRGYKPNWELINNALRKRGYDTNELWLVYGKANLLNNYPIYPEHNNKYYQECIENLKKKGIELDV